MMPTLKHALLALVCAALGVLVWLDNRPDPASGAVDTRTPTKQSGSDQPIDSSPEDASAGGMDVTHTDAIGAITPDRQVSGAELLSATGSREAAQHLTGETALGAVESAPNTVDAPSLNPLARVPIEGLNETVERPLISPSRKRPAQPNAAEAPLSPVKEDTYELVGVAVSNNRSVAVMRIKRDGTNVRVQEGDVLGGWQVSKVAPRSVLLQRADGQEETVRLYRR